MLSTKKLLMNLWSEIGSRTIRTSDCKIAWAQKESSRGISSTFKADFGLKPYPLLIDESDDGDRSIAHKSGQMSDVVEALLAGSSENSKAMKTFRSEERRVGKECR